MIVLFYILGCVFFILMQGVFASSEIAFVSSSLLKVRAIREKDRNTLFAYRLLLKPERFLATALVGTNISVVVSSSLATSLLIHLGFGQRSNIWVTFLMPPLIVIFAELVPKNIGRYYREELGIRIANVYRFLEILLFPVVSLIEKASLLVVRLITGKVKKRSFFVKREELLALAKEIEREGILEKGEKEAIEDVFDFGETKLKEVLTQSRNIVGIDFTDSRERIMALARERGFIRYPVFRDRKVAGYLNIFDLFYDEEKDWHQHIRPIIHVGVNQKSYQVFSLLKHRKENIAAVMRGTRLLGIVTLEDLIKEILSSIAR